VSQLTPETLPDDPAALKRLVIKLAAQHDKLETQHAELESQHAEFESQYKKVESERDSLAAECEQLKVRLSAVLQRMFGRRADKLDENQLQLFAEEIQRIRDEVGDNTSEPLPPLDESRRKQKQKRKPKRTPLPAELPRVVVEHDIPEDEKPCPCCGKERVVVAREPSEQLEIEEIKLHVKRHERLIYACPSCRDQIQRAEKPYQPIERSIAGPSLLAYLVTSKFEDHLPLYRIEKILKRAGVTLPRSTQVGLMQKTAELVQPLIDLMWQRVRGSPVIHTDDTTMPTQVKGRGRTKTGRLWPYIGRHGVPWDYAGSYVVVKYTNSRAGKHVADHLRDWSGNLLQADCFNGYTSLDKADELSHVACWAHGRRKFHEARATDIDRSTRAMAFIRTLYEIESEMRQVNLTADEIRDRRQRDSKPIVDAFLDWIEREYACGVLPKSPMGKAINYVLGHRKAFTAYLDDGRLAIDNNLTERMIRPIALGRKNFLFAGSERGGRTMATLMSLVCSARLHELNVHAYVTDVIERIAGLPISELPNLLPDRWKELQQQQGQAKERQQQGQAGEGS